MMTLISVSVIFSSCAAQAFLTSVMYIYIKALATILYASDPAAKVALAIAAEVMGFIVHVFYGIDALFEFKGEAV